jgi:hypothetical protein
MTTAADPTTMTIPSWGSAMISATDALQACSEACAGWQHEIARFVDLRLTQNQRSWEALMATRDIAGLVKVQQAWSLQAATDYTQEASRLTHLLATLAMTGTTPAVQETVKLVA